MARRRRWFADVEETLAGVYALAVALPDFGADAATGARLSSEEWSGLFDSLRRALGEADRYWLVFDPGRSDDVVAGSIADDLASVYQELSAGVAGLHSGVSPERVLGEWRLGFEIHWAKHALGALGAVRGLLGEPE